MPCMGHISLHEKLLGQVGCSMQLAFLATNGMRQGLGWAQYKYSGFMGTVPSGALYLSTPASSCECEASPLPFA